MKNVVTIYDAKTHLSKYIKKAEAGQTIYVGAFGKAQAVIAPLPKQQKQLHIGVWKAKKKIDYVKLKESDAEIAAWLEGEG